jgi:hypothetical protein
MVVILTYVSQFYHCSDQIPVRNNLKEELFILPKISEMSFHHGGEGMATQSSSHILAARKQRRKTGRGQEEL